MPQVHLFISGRVQGVFFRMHTHKKALELKLSGRVYNLDDGRVEVFAEGPEEKLELFIEWCHKGPPAARVENVEINWQEGERQFQDFRITD